MRVQDLLSKTRKIEVEFQGDIGLIEYRLNLFTPAFLAELTNKSLVDQVLDAVVTWDLVNEDGSAYPLDKEHLDVLPTEFLNKILTVIMGDMRAPDKAEKKD